MGVIYKLKEDVVHFIINQRQSNPLASCRQLAESTSQKFGLRLSKSSVHDVLKESGIITPRGRKPKTKFEIPQEKRKQIQVSLSQVKLIPYAADAEQTKGVPSVIIPPSVIEPKAPVQEPLKEEVIALFPPKIDYEKSAEYEGAGRIFLKAVLWDLGIFSEENIKTTDWGYYLTYCKGIKVVLENNKSFFIDLPLPLERCIKEVADGLINNIKPLIVSKISDEELLRASMNAQAGFKMDNISIVDGNDHVLLEFSNIMEIKRSFLIENRTFVDSNEVNLVKRTKLVFFSQIIDNSEVIDNILNLKGFDTTNKDKTNVTLLIDDIYENKSILEGAVEKLNGMYLYDEQNRLVSVKIESIAALPHQEG